MDLGSAEERRSYTGTGTDELRLCGGRQELHRDRG